MSLGGGAANVEMKYKGFFVGETFQYETIMVEGS